MDVHDIACLLLCGWMLHKHDMPGQETMLVTGYLLLEWYYTNLIVAMIGHGEGR